MNADSLSLLHELALWDAASSEEQLACVLACSKMLPEPFVFDKLETHTLGGQTHQIAHFQFQGSSFTLVPLFRWGNDFPISNSYNEKTWNLHKLPNSFGIMMNDSTYDCEICLGPKIRGGDGGGVVCGGIGNVTTWLPFASSFRIPDDEIDSWYMDDVLVRRIWPINDKTKA